MRRDETSESAQTAPRIRRLRYPSALQVLVIVDSSAHTEIKAWSQRLGN